LFDTGHTLLPCRRTLEEELIVKWVSHNPNLQKRHEETHFRLSALFHSVGHVLARVVARQKNRGSRLRSRHVQITWVIDSGSGRRIVFQRTAKGLQNVHVFHLRCIPPSKPAARDEGPRLIPLHVKTREQFLATTGDYCIALADKLLHRRHRHR